MAREVLRQDMQFAHPGPGGPHHGTTKPPAGQFGTGVVGRDVDVLDRSAHLVDEHPTRPTPFGDQAGSGHEGPGNDTAPLRPTFGHQGTEFGPQQGNALFRC